MKWPYPRINETELRELEDQILTFWDVTKEHPDGEIPQPPDVNTSKTGMLVAEIRALQREVKRLKAKSAAVTPRASRAQAAPNRGRAET